MMLRRQARCCKHHAGHSHTSPELGVCLGREQADGEGESHHRAEGDAPAGLLLLHEAGPALVLAPIETMESRRQLVNSGRLCTATGKHGN